LKKNSDKLTRVVHTALKMEKPRFLDYLLAQGYDIRDFDYKQLAILYLEVGYQLALQFALNECPVPNERSGLNICPVKLDIC